MSARKFQNLKEIKEFFEHLCGDNTSNEAVMQLYKTRAEEYDHDMSIEGVGYNGPRYVAEAAVRVMGDRKDARIIDCAAGTGWLGKLLIDAGFTNLDALDGTEEMLNFAKDKDVYRNYIISFIGNKTRLPIENGGYIVLTIWDICRDFYEPHLLQYVSDGRLEIMEKKNEVNFVVGDTSTTYVFQKCNISG